MEEDAGNEEEGEIAVEKLTKFQKSVLQYMRYRLRLKLWGFFRAVRTMPGVPVALRKKLADPKQVEFSVREMIPIAGELRPASAPFHKPGASHVSPPADNQTATSGSKLAEHRPIKTRSAAVSNTNGRTTQAKSSSFMNCAMRPGERMKPSVAQRSLRSSGAKHNSL